MGLTNTQYDTIMREYSRKQLRENRELEARRKEAYDRIPQLSELDSAVSSGAGRAVRALLEGNSDSGSAYRNSLTQIAAQRAALLKANGYPADYLEMHYDCPDCQDTGYIGGERCHCLRQAAIDLLYTQSGLKEILKEENFGTFSFAYYPDAPVNPATGLTPRQNMHHVVSECRSFIDRFDSEYANLFFYGETGLGKTFLSHCIAGELLGSSHSVIYYSAYDLFDLLAKETFRRESGSQHDPEFFTDCDLLIIDDLGTELTNAFVTSRLFLILNERISRRKSTIISTNLTLPAFSETYSERVFSRITSEFRFLGFYGNDIRIQKKLAQRR